MIDPSVPPARPGGKPKRNLVGRGVLALGVVALLWGLVQTLAGQLMPDVPGVVLTDLHRVEDLRVRFNQDQGTPRLILLLSPT